MTQPIIQVSVEPGGVATPEPYKHVAWHCDACGKEQTKITHITDVDRWYCDPCIKIISKPGSVVQPRGK